MRMDLFSSSLFYFVDNVIMIKDFIVYLNFMSNKQKLIKLLIFFIIFFSLLVNLVYLSYEKIYEDGNYAVYNNEIIKRYENIHPNTSLEIKQQIICSNLKCPLGDLAIYYKLIFLAILLTIVSIIIVFLSLIFRRHKKMVLSCKDIFIIVSSDYYFAYCVKFL